MKARDVLGDIVTMLALVAAAGFLIGFCAMNTGCMTTTVRFGADGKVSEIKHANLLRVGTAIIHAPEGGGADVSTTAQGMSPELAGVMRAGIDKVPGQQGAGLSRLVAGEEEP